MYMIELRSALVLLVPRNQQFQAEALRSSSLCNRPMRCQRPRLVFCVLRRAVSILYQNEMRNVIVVPQPVTLIYMHGSIVIYLSKQNKMFTIHLQSYLFCFLEKGSLQFVIFLLISYESALSLKSFFYDFRISQVHCLVSKSWMQQEKHNTKKGLDLHCKEWMLSSHFGGLVLDMQVSQNL